MKKSVSLSPLRILEKTSRKELGKGNLGVLIARAGVGKTACLIQIALENLMQHKKLVHVSLAEGPEKIISYYNVIHADLRKESTVADDRDVLSRMEKDRMILAYLNKSFEPARLHASLTNLTDNLNFIPSVLIIDGLDFENTERKTFVELKKISSEFEAEIWFSALSHRHITNVNERGIPYPCHEIDDLFSIILQVQPEASGISLRLLKEHDNPTVHGVSIKLNPSTLLPAE